MSCPAGQLALLFNSPEFITLFLPITLLVYLGMQRLGRVEYSLYWLILASLFFYGWWEPRYLLLISASILVNYLLALRLVAAPTRPLLALGIFLNLLLLGYYKYANFFVSNISELFGIGWTLDAIILPLAISFFTFQQIAYLVDTFRGKVQEHRFSHYCLFVTFFPQLVAGPIVHHSEMLPQFFQQRHSPGILARGISIFIIGLFKKVVIADGIAGYSTPAFSAAAEGVVLGFTDAWVAALAYTFQLYFDFSGYCDMAIGLALMFGIRLPLNFNSPYKSSNIIDFWRRWHMTMSRFLRDYLYSGLGGNRKGSLRRYLNLFFTMLLGGLWHGANWTFVVWGALHGLYLIINHGWRQLVAGWRTAPVGKIPDLSLLGRGLTFLAVVFSWVYFRSDSINTANQIVSSMLGRNGFSLPDSLYVPFFSQAGSWSGVVDSPGALVYLAILLICVWTLPNTLQLIPLENSQSRENLAVDKMSWKMNMRWGFLVGCFATGIVACFMIRDRFTQSEFLYFNF